MNNLFSFATKELSQDAVICWMINWMTESEKGDPKYNLGKDILNLFLGEKAIADFQNVKVYRQYKHIDVLITYVADDEKHALIIEDKTNTSEHSHQIRRYIETLKEDEGLALPAENIAVAYVKTGIHYDADKRVKANVVNLEQLVAVIGSYQKSIPSEILYNYWAFLEEERRKRKSIDALIEKGEYSARVRTGEADSAEPILGTYYGQYCLLNTLFPERDIYRWVETANPGDDSNPDYSDSIYGGANNNGSPWTQYCFWGKQYREQLSNSKKRECHYLFWRVDRYSERGASATQEPTYYLALRHYDEHAHSKNPKVNERKDRVYTKLRELYEALLLENRDIIKEIGSRSVYKESDLIFIPIAKLQAAYQADPQGTTERLRNITSMFIAAADALQD